MIRKIFALNLQFIENRIEEWQRRYDIEKKMYEKEIRKARSEIEEVQADLKKLTTEVIILKL